MGEIRVLKLILVVIVVFVSYSYAIYDLTHLNKRSTSTSCSSYSSCSSCNLIDDCNYLNSQCQDYDMYTLSNTDFDEEAEYPYCNEIDPDDGYIYMSKTGYSVDLFASPNTSATSHSICEWRVLFKTSMDVYVDITRSTDQNEELYMYTNTNQVENYYYSKDLTSCSETATRMVLSNTGYIRVVAKKLNDNSNYLITLSQPYNAPFDYSPIIWTACALTICISIIILVALFYFGCKYLRDPPHRVNIHRQQISKLKLIAKCLDNMRFGKFAHMDVKFGENACVICLEDFAYNSEVYITNECEHVFHAKCLDEWFRHLRCDQDLVCPHCNTQITGNSKKPEMRAVDISNCDNASPNHGGLCSMSGVTQNMITHQLLRSINRSSLEFSQLDDEEEKEEQDNLDDRIIEEVKEEAKEEFSENAREQVQEELDEDNEAIEIL